MKWRIYYDDGGIWDHKDGFPLPNPFGVLVILQDSVNGSARYMSAGDFYIFDGDGWLAVDQAGLNDYIIHQLSKIKCVVVGRMVPDARFREIYAQAKKDADNSALD